MLHFVPEDGPNPLDNACFKNLIACANRTRSNPVNKKKLMDPAIIRSIIGRHGAEEALLKDFRIAARSSLGFAGFFVLTSWLIFSQNTLRFAMVLLKFLCQGIKWMYIEKATMSISLSYKILCLTNLEVFRPGRLSLFPWDTSLHVGETSLHFVMKRSQVLGC